MRLRERTPAPETAGEFAALASGDSKHVKDPDGIWIELFQKRR